MHDVYYSFYRLYLYLPFQSSRYVFHFMCFIEMSQDYMEVDILFVKYLLAHIYNAIHTGSKVIVKRHRIYQLYLSAGFVTFPEYLPTYLPTQKRGAKSI